MVAQRPRSRGFRPCRRGPCLCAVLALVTPAAAGAPAPDLPDWLAARLRATTAGAGRGRPGGGGRDGDGGQTGHYFPPPRCPPPPRVFLPPRDPPWRPGGGA